MTKVERRMAMERVVEAREAHRQACAMRGPARLAHRSVCIEREVPCCGFPFTCTEMLRTYRATPASQKTEAERAVHAAHKRLVAAKAEYRAAIGQTHPTGAQ